MAAKAPSSSKDQLLLNRGAWTANEDKLLSDYVKINGETGWNSIPRKTGLKQCGKSCRLRWLNYLRPGIKRGNISSDEEELIVRLHGLLGNRWSLIAGRSNDNSRNKQPACCHATSEKEKGYNKYVASDSSNHETTDPAQTVNDSDLLAEQFMTDHDSDIIDFTVAAELESPSVEIKGQYSPGDFGIEEVQASPCNHLEMSFLSNYIEQVENSADAGCNGMEELYTTQHGDWMDELQYFQM